MTDWYNSSWPYRKKITLHGENISGNHTNFPFLFKINEPDSDLASHGLSDGTDFIFTTDDGTTRVHHEIENWLNGSGCIWVRAPTLTDETDADFYLYYGEGTDHTSDTGYLPSGVWDNNYIMVQHMYDYPSNSYISGSTTRHLLGTKGGAGEPTEITGIIHKGQDFDGNDYIDCTQDSSLNLDSSITLECWVKIVDKGQVDTANYQYFLSRRAATWQKGYEFYSIDSNYARFLINDGTSRYITDDVSIADNIWHQIIGIRDVPNDKLRLYIDGNIAVNPVTDESTGSIAATTSFVIGQSLSDIGNRNVKGLIDEIRVSDMVRNWGWIKTSYSSQSSPSTFFDLLTEEPYPIAEENELYVTNVHNQYGRLIFTGNNNQTIRIL